MPLVIDIADSVVSELNAQTFSQTFTAQRHYLPVFSLPEMKDLHVTVVPKSVTIQPAGRAHNQHACAIDVAVQKKLQSAENAEIDPLLNLADEIADHFRFKRLDSFPDAIWIKTEHSPIYAPEHLDQLRQFTSVLTLTFRVVREVR